MTLYGVAMNQTERNVNEYAVHLLSDKSSLDAEYKSYAENGYCILNISGKISPETLYALICAARGIKKLRDMLHSLQIAASRQYQKGTEAS